ncbi:hypothetical protein [Arthrobacter sp. YC-RL1]|uniref:hypothetical protein n=1 Tax=Arthrobacter sp. YC-RL1 TaxID=1652545 RepID=UPI00128DD5B1|nr:hypothetical protein [Arthrobacter sp. YC-RL1]
MANNDVVDSDSNLIIRRAEDCHPSARESEACLDNLVARDSGLEDIRLFHASQASAGFSGFYSAATHLIRKLNC